MNYALFANTTLFSVWVSFAELYNERVYDLLETVCTGKLKRRKELKLLQDRNGFVYVKDLTEVHVTSDDEAYKIFLAGRKNLQFASTQMNQKSSRSHSFFTLRVVTIGIGEGLIPFPKSVHRLTFCDLAGMERVHETENEGARLKESGNINASLTVLLKVIRLLREKQLHKTRMIEAIPFRESKLTHIFKSFFTSSTHICMIVNINPDPATANSTFRVLHNSAIASNVIVFRPMETKAEKISEEAPPTRGKKCSKKQKKHVNFAARNSIKVSAASSPSSDENRKPGFEIYTSSSPPISDEDASTEEVPAPPTVIARNHLLHQKVTILERENRELKMKISQLELEKERIRDESVKLLAEQNRLWSSRLRDARFRQENFNQRRISLMMKNQLEGGLSPGNKCGWNWNCTPPVVDMENIKEESDIEMEETDVERDLEDTDIELSELDQDYINNEAYTRGGGTD